MSSQVSDRFQRILVRWSQVGFHSWPGAPEHRGYLAARHRHMFHYAARMDVAHDDREVEFHDLLDVCRAFTARFGEELGGSSCEQLAGRVVDELASRYPGRHIEVTCSEDGEVDAIVSTTP